MILDTLPVGAINRTIHVQTDDGSIDITGRVASIGAMSEYEVGDGYGTTFYAGLVVTLSINTGAGMQVLSLNKLTTTWEYMNE